MALSVKVDTFAAATSTGNQSVTGVGFQPTAIVFFGCNATADGFTISSVCEIGFGVSSSERASFSTTSEDAKTTMTISRESENNSVLNINNGAGSNVRKADLVSLDADGFTVNWSSAQTGGRLINFIALGGADLTDVDVRTFTSPTSTGTQAYTGAGFQPDCLIAIGGAYTALSAQSYAVATVGFSDGSSDFCLGFTDEIGATSDTYNQQRTDCLINALVANTTFERANVSSMDANGYTLNWSTVNASGRYYSILALKGGQYKVGTSTTPTSSGTDATTGVGFEPSGIVLLTGARTTENLSNDYIYGLGAASGATERAFCGGTSDDAAAVSICDRSQEQDEVLQMLSPNQVLDEEADISSLDADGFTLNYSTADGTQRVFGYLAVGSDAVAPTGDFPFRKYYQQVGSV